MGQEELTVHPTKIYYRSSYEFRFLNYCESKKIACKPCNIAIPYIDKNGNKRNYLPDFIVNNLIVEIKPKKLLSYGLIPLKISAGINYCEKTSYKFILVTEKELESIENAKDGSAIERYGINFN